MNDGKTWIIEVKDSSAEQAAVLGNKVPLWTMNDKIELYHPQTISLGPQHFKLYGRSPNFNVSEDFKSEVVGRFDLRLKEPGFKSLVENLKSNHMKRLEENYSIEVLNRFPREDRPDVFSWMVARDGCVVLEVLHSFEDTPEAENRQKTELQYILKRDNRYLPLNHIVNDMLKLENQLPFWVLEESREGLEEMERPKGNWFESALKNLSPVEVRGKVGSHTYKNRIHILQLLGEYMVDNKAVPSPSTTHHGKENHHAEADDKALLSGCTRRHGEENHEKQFRYVIRGIFAVFFVVYIPSISIYLFLLLMIECISKTYMRGYSYIPTVEELHRIGVKFKKLDGKGISHIKFNKSKSTLYLPKFTVDDRSEVILRNLLAMERQWEDTEKTITRYVVFINDLINTGVDVARLRRQGIIVNKLGSDDDVARLWNSVTIPATNILSYEQIDMAVKDIIAYRRKWWRFLWGQFWMIQYSKIWLFASQAGGLLFLLFTFVKVVLLIQRL